MLFLRWKGHLASVVAQECNDRGDAEDQDEIRGEESFLDFNWRECYSL